MAAISNLRQQLSLTFPSRPAAPSSSSPTQLLSGPLQIVDSVPKPPKMQRQLFDAIHHFTGCWAHEASDPALLGCHFSLSLFSDRSVALLVFSAISSLQGSQRTGLGYSSGDGSLVVSLTPISPLAEPAMTHAHGPTIYPYLHLGTTRPAQLHPVDPFCALIRALTVVSSWLLRRLHPLRLLPYYSPESSLTLSNLDEQPTMSAPTGSKARSLTKGQEFTFSCRATLRLSPSAHSSQLIVLEAFESCGKLNQWPASSIFAFFLGSARASIPQLTRGFSTPPHQIDPHPSPNFPSKRNLVKLLRYCPLLEGDWGLGRKSWCWGLLGRFLKLLGGNLMTSRLQSHLSSPNSRAGNGTRTKGKNPLFSG
ncbi:UNVERIFIED_CONTAM: hypothetical protein Sindi_0627000 [Sesamum indicum]